jgi:hypothetical protein
MNPNGCICFKFYRNVPAGFKRRRLALVMQHGLVLPILELPMFAVARSIFWLGVAYMVIKPGAELPNAQALSEQALAAGTQMVAEQVEAMPCDSLQCYGGKAMIAAVIESSLPAADPMHVPAAIGPVPYPMPRPDWRDDGRPQGA